MYYYTPHQFLSCFNLQHSSCFFSIEVENSVDPESDGFVRSQLNWIYSVIHCKRIYPGSIGQVLRLILSICNKARTLLLVDLQTFLM